jgi:hypothetical protein
MEDMASAGYTAHGRPSAPGGPVWSSWASLLPIGGDRGLLLGSGRVVVRVAVEPEAVPLCSTRREGHAGPSAAAWRHP